MFSPFFSTDPIVSLTRTHGLANLSDEVAMSNQHLGIISSQYNIGALQFNPLREDGSGLIDITTADSLTINQSTSLGNSIDVSDKTYLIVRAFSSADDGGVSLTPFILDAEDVSLLETKQTGVGEIALYHDIRTRYFMPLLFWQVVQAQVVKVHITRIIGTNNAVTVEAAVL